MQMMVTRPQDTTEPESGYLYLLTCPDVAGVIKIGTAQHDIGDFTVEPFGTTEPIACKVEFAIHVPNLATHERTFLRKLVKDRVPNGEKLFALDTDEAISEIIQIVGHNYTNAATNSVKFPEQVATIKQLESDHRKRQKNYRALKSEIKDLGDQIRHYRREDESKKADIERNSERIEQLNAKATEITKITKRWRVAVYASLSLAFASVAAAGIIRFF